jgi:16S rRNA (cytosine967-C5)-methyltransferase
LNTLNASKTSLKSSKNARLIALEIWMLVFYQEKKLDEVINNSIDFNKLDKRDKAFVYLIINTSMRRQKQAKLIYNHFANTGIKNRNRYLNSILTIASVQLIWLKVAPHAVLNNAVEQAKKYGGDKQSKLVNALLRNMLRNESEWINLILDDSVNLPEWIFKSWSALYGEKAVREIVHLAMEPPPLDIIVSKKVSKKEKQKLKLELNGEEILPNVLRCKFNGPIEFLPRYYDGIWWIQDAASQIPCNLLLTKIPKHFINTKITSLKFLDLCSAPGGKAAQLLDNDLDIVCVEKNESRSKRFDENMKRLNFKSNIYIANAENYDPGFKPDIVLIDAPCSATGTIRRNPDIFIKPAPKNLNDLIKIQDNILKNASKILNKNGIIMYITCSLQKIEGERRIEKFLIEQSNFSIIPFYPNEYPLIESCITKEGFLRILPNNLNFGSDNIINGSDGFFVSLLKMDT